ncbi:MAG: hypothetical protein GXN98_03105 [Euryarchaeota archaeon]|nr:hypothetical protein [Euryarchaeota archaeon]
MDWRIGERTPEDEGIYLVAVVDEKGRLKLVQEHATRMLGEHAAELLRIAGISEGDALLEELLEPGKGERVAELQGASMCFFALPAVAERERGWILLLKRRESTQEDLEEIRRSILENVTHELLTPVTIAKASLELLEMGEESALQPAMNAVRRLEALAEVLQSLSSREKPANTCADVRRAIDAALERVSEVCRSRDMKVEVELEQGLPLASACVESLVQVLVALLSNAIKFSERGSRIRVSARLIEELRSLEPGSIEVCVEDEGIGIPEEEQERIFGLFYQIDRGADRRYGGMGAGLSLVKKLAEEWGGEVSVESVPGKGSKFCVRIPAEHGVEVRAI